MKRKLLPIIVGLLLLGPLASANTWANEKEEQEMVELLDVLADELLIDEEDLFFLVEELGIESLEDLELILEDQDMASLENESLEDLELLEVLEEMENSDDLGGNQNE